MARKDKGEQLSGELEALADLLVQPEDKERIWKEIQRRLDLPDTGEFRDSSEPPASADGSAGSH